SRRGGRGGGCGGRRRGGGRGGGAGSRSGGRFGGGGRGRSSGFVSRLGHRAALGGDPFGEGLLADHLDVDRHEGVVDAAQFRALAVVVAFLLGAEPGLVHTARNGVDLDGEGRNGDGVDDVRSGDQQADVLADRHHHRLIGGQAVQLLGRLVFRQHVRDVLGHALVRIFIAPVPLVAGDL